jgi:hypothetical protein
MPRDVCEEQLGVVIEVYGGAGDVQELNSRFD